MHARTGNEPEEHIGTTVLVLCVRRLNAKLVRMCPGRATRRALVVREPCEEPVVRAVLVVDLERHEQTSAEGDRSQNCAASEGSYADADALQCIATVRAVEGEMGYGLVAIRPKPA